VRARILSAAAVFPVAFTALALWLLTPWAPATGSDLAAAAASAALAFLGWAGFAFLAAWTRPERAEWTRAEIAALKDRMDLKELLDATPKRGRR